MAARRLHRPAVPHPPPQTRAVAAPGSGGGRARTKKNRRPYHGTLLLYRILHIFWLRLMAKICRFPQFFQFFRASIIKIFARDIQIRVTTCIDLHAWALPSFYSCMLDYAPSWGNAPAANPKSQNPKARPLYILFSMSFWREWKIFFPATENSRFFAPQHPKTVALQRFS